MKEFTVCLVILLIYDLIESTFLAIKNWNVMKKAFNSKKKEILSIIQGMFLSMAVIFTLLFYAFAR